MYRAGIWDGKDGKTGKRDLGSKDGKVGRDMGLFSRFPIHFPFFFKPVLSPSLLAGRKILDLGSWKDYFIPLMNLFDSLDSNRLFRLLTFPDSKNR
jgi:hypothetical protein